MLELQNSPSDHVAVMRFRLRKREFVIFTPKFIRAIGASL